MSTKTEKSTRSERSAKSEKSEKSVDSEGKKDRKKSKEKSKSKEDKEKRKKSKKKDAPVASSGKPSEISLSLGTLSNCFFEIGLLLVEFLRWRAPPSPHQFENHLKRIHWRFQINQKRKVSGKNSFQNNHVSYVNFSSYHPL